MILLLAHRRHDWRPWLKERGGSGLVLDPSFAEYGWPGRLQRVKGGKVVDWRFHGALDAAADPISLLTRTLELAAEPADWALLFPAETPLLRHLQAQIARLLAPAAILSPEGLVPESAVWPIGPELVEPAKPFPDMVVQAQRRARWLELWKAGREHVIDLGAVALEGARLGSGQVLSSPGEPWRERLGATLTAAQPQEPTPEQAARLMQDHLASRLHHIDPADYEGLLCSLARQDGEDFSMGVIQRMDLEARRAVIWADAEPEPAVRILRIGTLRLSRDGIEAESIRPWTV
jgi:hypothetical protein